MSTIKSSTTLTTAYSVEADTTGALVIQTGATPTTALTISSAQVVTLAQVLPEASGGTGTTVGYNGFKNRIINGAMSFWQRGTSFVSPTVGGGNFYTADRWGANRAGDVAGATVSRSTDVPSGFQYSLKLQRTAGDTSTAGIYIFNSNETANTIDLAGHPITLSFWVKTGANYSGGALSIQGFWGTGTDQRVYAYTGATTFINTTQAITSTWTRYSFTGTVGASSTEVGFQLFWTPTGTAGADDSIYITGVQLEKGSTATSFDYRPYGAELMLCQRYYQAPVTSGLNFFAGYQTAGNYGPSAYSQFPVEMRTTPTATIVTTLSNVSSTANYYDSRSFQIIPTYTATGYGFFYITSLKLSAEL